MSAALYRHDYYGVPLWLLKDYLHRLGAVETSENVMEAEGWRVVLSKAPPNRIGSLVIGGAVGEFSGDETALVAMFERLHLMTMRGGG